MTSSQRGFIHDICIPLKPTISKHLSIQPAKNQALIPIPCPRRAGATIRGQDTPRAGLVLLRFGAEAQSAEAQSAEDNSP
jgi:hypothetical protein